MNIAAGFSAAIFATKARRAFGELACVSEAAVKRVSPYAIHTKGSGRSASATLKVGAAGIGAAAMRPRNKTMGKATRIARCYGLGRRLTMKIFLAVLLCVPVVAAA